MMELEISVMDTLGMGVTSVAVFLLVQLKTSNTINTRMKILLFIANSVPMVEISGFLLPAYYLRGQASQE